jgi:PAS domain S-box-containing protein
MIKIDLIYNLAVLIALSALSGFIELRFSRNEIKGKILQGVLFGMTAMIGMLYPFHLTKGIIFDGRSIVISLCTLFFGPVPGSIASSIAITYRIYLGGGGVLTGSLVILSSFIIGALFYYRKIKTADNKFSNFQLYIFGLLVNGITLILFSILPFNDKIEMYMILFPTVLGIYPLATLLIGKILLDQEEKQIFLNKITESEERWQFALEGAGDGVWDWNVKTNEVYFSKQWKAMLGYSDNEINNHFAAWENLLHPEDKAGVLAEIDKHIKGETSSYQSVQRLKCKDGSYKWILDRGKILKRDAHGEPLRIIGTHSDISDDKEAEIAAKESEQKYKRIVEHTPDGVIIHSKGKTLYANPAAAKMIGAESAEHLLEIPVMNFVHPDSMESVITRLKKILETGETSDFVEEKLIKLNKETLIAEIIGIPIQYKGKTAIQTIVRDITERKKAELALKESEEKFKLAFQTSPDSVNINRLSDGLFIAINEGFTRITGYTEEDIFSKTSLEINIWVNPEDRTKLIQELKKNGRVTNLEAKFRFKNDHIVFGLMSASIISINNELCIISITRDISERKIVEEALQENERKMRTIVEGTPHLFFYTQNSNAELTYISPTVEQISGYTVDEWLNRKDWFTTDSKINQLAREKTHSHLKGKFAIEPTLIEIYHSNGNIITLEVFETSVFKDGKVIGLQGVAHDITERKKVEEEILQSEKTFSEMFHKSPASIILTVPNEGTILDVNEAFLKGTYYLKDEVIGHSTLELGLFDDLDDRKQILYMLNTFGSVSDFECRFRDKNGKIIIALLSIVFIKQKGKTVQLNTVIDITERKTAEEEIRKLYRGVEQSPASVLITNTDGDIEYVNKKFCEVTGYSYDEIIGKNPRILSSGEKTREEYKQVWDTILSGNDWRGEFHNRRKNGELFWESAAISPIQNEKGEITHFIGIKEDITEKKRMIDALVNAKEKAEEINQLKSNFLSNMSHELRTPLVGILGYADFLRQEIESGELKDMADTIYNSGKRLSETLNLILDLSQFERDQKSFEFQKIDLVRKAKEVVTLFKETARKKGLELKTSFNRESIIVNFDERAFYSILNNLINNALKFTSEGSVTSSIYVKYNFIEIKVSDTGIGIAECDQRIIFEEFRQASEGFSRNFEGSGLGLSITRKLIEKIGGNISVESEVGKGSTFTVKLPLTIVEEDKKYIGPGSSLNHFAPEQLTKKPLALLVDDDPFVYQIMKRYISEYINLETITDANFAIKMLEKKKYDLIFMDINLGRGMDGKQATKAIRKMKGYESIPVIATTAYAMVGDKEEFLNAGCSHYLSKPFGKKDILKILEEVFKLL